MQGQVNTAQRLRKIRRLLGLGPQKALAFRLGATPTQYTNWETSGAIRLRFAVCLCNITGVTLDYLYRGKIDCLPQTLVHVLEGMMFDEDSAEVS